MGKTVKLNGVEFTPNKHIAKQEREASKRVQMLVNKITKAEKSLVNAWLKASGKLVHGRQLKKVTKTVTPFEQVKEAGKFYESAFIYSNYGSRDNNKMFTLSVIQIETGFRIDFENTEKNEAFQVLAEKALTRIKF